MLRTAITLIAAAFVASCAPQTPEAEPPAPEPRIVQAGAPGDGTRVHDPADRVETGRHTAADVRFMQMMIVHHAQALEMTELVPERTDRADIRLLARRIELAQEDEIAMMQRWLRDRGEDVPDPRAPHAHHGHAAHAGMAGMLTGEQMERLAGTWDAAFDRLFLELMIHHHEGAIVMVEELLASPGAAQEAEIFELASHVHSDQRVEIDRMRQMLRAGG